MIHSIEPSLTPHTPLTAALQPALENCAMTYPIPPRPKRPSSSSLVFVIVATACVLVASDAMGCPNCKDAVNTADPEGLNLARGYFYSILIMLAMPCTLICSFGAYVWREMQRQKREGLLDSDTAHHQPSGQAFRQPGDSPQA